MHSSVIEDVTANIHLAQASRGYQLAMLNPMQFPQSEISS